MFTVQKKKLFKLDNSQGIWRDSIKDRDEPFIPLWVWPKFSSYHDPGVGQL